MLTSDFSIFHVCFWGWKCLCFRWKSKMFSHLWNIITAKQKLCRRLTACGSYSTEYRTVYLIHSFILDWLWTEPNKLRLRCPTRPLYRINPLINVTAWAALWCHLQDKCLNCAFLSDCVSSGVLSPEEDRAQRPKGTHTHTHIKVWTEIIHSWLVFVCVPLLCARSCVCSISQS